MICNAHIIDYLELAMDTQRHKKRRLNKIQLRKILSLQERWNKEVEKIES